MIINSADNKLIKYAAALKQKKYRDKHGEFLAEGLISVTDILKSDFDSVKYVFAVKNQANKLVELLKKSGIILSNDFLDNRLVLLDPILIKKLSDTVAPQEVIALAAQKSESKPLDFCLYLDRIRDPGNLGTIIRSAAAAGYSLILDDCADIFSPKVVRSSMSGIMSVNFCYANSDTLLSLKKDNYILVAADADGKNLYSLKSADFGLDSTANAKTKKVCILVGNEAQGIKNEILSLCSHTVSIPMQNIESLNAAVSAAIIMYHFKHSLFNTN